MKNESWMKIRRWVVCDLWNGQRPSDRIVLLTYWLLALIVFAAALNLFAPALVCWMNDGSLQELTSQGRLFGLIIAPASCVIVGVLVGLEWFFRRAEPSVLRKWRLIGCAIFCVMFLVLYPLCHVAITVCPVL